MGFDFVLTFICYILWIIYVYAQTFFLFGGQVSPVSGFDYTTSLSCYFIGMYLL